MIEFDHDGRRYEFDQNKLDLTEAIIIKETTGLTIKDFQLGMESLDPFALRAMVWLARRRTGVAGRLLDVTFDCMELILSVKYTDATPGVATDPTLVPTTPDGSGSGTIPGADVTNTSEPSLITSG